MVRLLIATLLFGPLLAVGCGQPATPDAASTGAGTAPSTTATDVVIQNFAFGPQTLTVPVGATVRWTNKDSVAHNVIGGKGTFDSGILAQGRAFTFKFTQAGTFSYSCTLHSGMTATITVI